MQANSIGHSFYRASEPTLDMASEKAKSDHISHVNSVGSDDSTAMSEPMIFHGQFENCMEMHADAVSVAQYLDQHQEWFRRCAKPMTAESLGDNGYALTIGKFGSFGYDVEPKIGLNLLPQREGVYRIETIPIPDYIPSGYTVDFCASLELAELPLDAKSRRDAEPFTIVEWELDLKVTIQFPRFIHALPQSLIQSTGDRLLQEIVRQVSKRLTHKVQADFHASMGIPFVKPRHAFWR